MSKINYDVDIDDSVHNVTILTSISTFIKPKTNYDVGIDDIIHKMTISTMISTYSDKVAKY